MFSNFSRIKIYNVYHDIVSYFTPTFVVFLFGFFAQYPTMQYFAAQTMRFSIVLQVLIVLVLFTAVGKLIYELSGFVINFLRLIYYRFAYMLGRREGVLGSLGKKMSSLAPRIEHEEVSSLKIHTLFAKEEPLKSWYARLRMAAFSFQTAFGGVVLGFFIYEKDRVLFLALLIILFLLALSTQKKLMIAESEIERIAKGK